MRAVPRGSALLMGDARATLSHIGILVRFSTGQSQLLDVQTHAQLNGEAMENQIQCGDS